MVTASSTVRSPHARGASVTLESDDLATATEREATAGRTGILRASGDGGTARLDEDRTKVTLATKDSRDHERKRLSR